MNIDLLLFILEEAYDFTESDKPSDLKEVADRIKEAIELLKERA